MSSTFGELVIRATGHAPYPYQHRLADNGLPEVLAVPTGSGKTLAAVLPWLWRRRYHPDDSVRADTPRWLVYVLPMRVLVEQTADVVSRWMTGLELEADVAVHVVMGGEGRVADDWRRYPERDAIFVGTLDMLVSRALNRGYGESRFTWPIDFGLFNNGCQWVFDEVQLMGPALPTTRQLQGLREAIGTAMPCASMWMSATVDRDALLTADRPVIGSTAGLADDDRTGALARRLEAGKWVERIEADPKRYASSIAAVLGERHRPGTLTLAVLNTVERAREVAHHLRALGGPDTLLLHSRFRPAERTNRVGAALAPVDPAGPGRIVVSTQVVEAGVDISASTMLVEAAPWPSIVQRAGRCNRDGAALDPSLLWVSPPKPEPYPASDVESAIEALSALEARCVTSPELGRIEVNTEPVVHSVLRRRDLVDLFDTTPDLSGNDIDVGRFIRDRSDDLDLQVAWRDLPGEGPDADEPAPARDELCPVPVYELRGRLTKAAKAGKPLGAWRFDHLDSRWVRASAGELRPGQLLLLRAAEGGYSSTAGWDPKSMGAVPPSAPNGNGAVAPAVEAVSADPATFGRRSWVTLANHLADVEREVRDLAISLEPPGLGEDLLDAAAVAGRLHDVGKAHPVFQMTLRHGCGANEEPPRAEVWAKSPFGGRHERRYFRHELASALALLDEGSTALDGLTEADLAVYLVAAHHGRVRLGIRSLPDETPDPDDPGRRIALGIHDGELLPRVELPAGSSLPASSLDLSVMELGDAPDGSPSWSARALTLRDRSDLGIFRLAFLEALVRLADWRASADPTHEET